MPYHQNAVLHSYTHRLGLHTAPDKLKLKESRNRLGVAQRPPGGLGSQISMTFGTRRWWGTR